MSERNTITREYLRSILNYDPETGVFTWAKSSGARGRIPAGTPAGNTTTGRYLTIRIDGALYYAHRLAFMWTQDNCPALVDHIDGDKLNNRWANLRSANKSANSINSGTRQSTISGYRGVGWCARTRKWRAIIQKDGRRIDLGRYPEKDDALRAYESAAERLFGEYRRPQIK